MLRVAADPTAHSREHKRYKGVRRRNGGKSWVSEIRLPNSREKIWLGSYRSAEQAARAYDVAAYYIRGSGYVFFNFPALIQQDHPSPLMFPHQQDLDSPISRSLIRHAAASAAASFCLPSPSSLPTTSINDSFSDNHANAQPILDPADMIAPSCLDSRREQMNDNEQEWRSLFTMSEDHQHEFNLYRVSSLDFPALDDYAWTPQEDAEEDDYDLASGELGGLWNI